MKVKTNELYALLVIGMFVMQPVIFILTAEENISIVLVIEIIIFTYLVFSVFLRAYLKKPIISENIFVFLTLTLVYTLYPAIKFLDFNQSSPIALARYKIASAEVTLSSIANHLLLHYALMLFTMLGYIGFELISPRRSKHIVRSYKIRTSTVWIILAVIAICYSIMLGLSGDVETYYGHYTRYDHLPPVLRKIVQAVIAVKNGGYYVVLVLMFNNYRAWRKRVYFVLLVFCVFELLVSRGSRIGVFFLILATVGLYESKVARIKIKKIVTLSILLIVVFVGIERIRIADNRKVVTGRTYRVTEFDAVFNSGYHIYSEREKLKLPKSPWQMRVYELIAIIPLLNHTEYHPMYWYARQYFQKAIIPPATTGIIAVSGIWGGHVYLIVTSLCLGSLFAMLSRWYSKRIGRWWADTIQIYLYATSVLVLKYSMVYQVVPLVQTLLPAMIVFWPIVRINRIKTIKTSDNRI